MTAYYSDSIVAKTKDDSYTDREGHFVVTDKVGYTCKPVDKTT